MEEVVPESQPTGSDLITKRQDYRAREIINTIHSNVHQLVAKFHGVRKSIRRIEERDELETDEQNLLYKKRRAYKIEVLEFIRQYAIVKTWYAGRWEGEDISDFDQVARRFYTDTLKNWNILEFEEYEVDENNNRAHEGVYGIRAFMDISEK